MLMVWEPGTSKNRSAPLSKQERISRNSERIFQPQKLLPQPGIKNLGGGLNKKYMFQIFFQSSLRINFSVRKTNHRSSHHRNPCPRQTWWIRVSVRVVEIRIGAEWWWVEVLGRCRCFCQPSHGSILAASKNDDGDKYKDPYLGWVSGWKLVYN